MKRSGEILRASFTTFGSGFRETFKVLSLDILSLCLSLKQKSNGAAAMTNRSYFDDLSSPTTAASISSVVSILIALHRGGVRDVGPRTSATSAPLEIASEARAMPMRPELELVRYLTGSR